MTRAFHSFLVAESGAVTVDWVVLTAVAAAFGLIVATTLGSGTDDVAANIETSFTQMQVAPLATLGYSQ
jgi:hypothetical protein